MREANVSSKDLEKKLLSLEQKVQQLEDIEAIRKLKAKYTFALDKRDWDTVLNCFTDDTYTDWGVFAGGSGIYKGKQGVKQFFTVDVPKAATFFVHMVHNDLIEVNGNQARGRWYYEEPMTWAAENRAGWIVGTYDEKFVKQGGEWKIKEVKVTHFYQTPYDAGWVKENRG
jgi:hypothetical protein